MPCRAATHVAEGAGVGIGIAMAATILIVEDEHAVARGIQYALQQEGYEVTLARSGEEGLEIADPGRAGPDPARRPAAGHGRLRGAAPAARRGHEVTGADADRP